MDQLSAVPEDEEIDFLYSLIRQDPDFFQAFDRTQFADTPLHLATSEGRRQLALEILRLMPSFGMKLNPDGFSPLDLAIRLGHTDIVTAMVKMDSALVRVQGREGFTPLHYAAEIDDANSLALFLDRCPDSIEVLTIHGESAVHVAVKNGKLTAFKVLLGWLQRTDKTGVLLWRDFNRNNVLHLAASTNQPKVMELLFKDSSVVRFINETNSKGSTALDMVMELPPEVNGKALQILQCKRAKRGSSFNSHTERLSGLVDYLSSPISIFEKIIKFEVILDIGLRSETRNAILVVAVLIATAMYQAVLSPPGGVSDQTPIILNITGASLNGSLTITNITSNIRLDGPKLGQMGAGDDGNEKVSMPKDDFLTFTSLNSIAFAASLAMIFLVLPSRPYNLFLYVSLLFLMMSYLEALSVISPPGTVTYVNIIAFTSLFILYLIVLVKGFLLPGQNYVRATGGLKGTHIYRRHEAIAVLLHNQYSCANYFDAKRY